MINRMTGEYRNDFKTSEVQGYLECLSCVEVGERIFVSI